MKVSYNTLKQYIPSIKSPEETAQDLIMHTAEVEEIHYEGDNLKDVYIGKILQVEKHPDSEKLNICQVEVLEETKQIVCGAENVREGLIVPVAIVGAQLTADFQITKTKIRGVSSEGMIASEDELGLIEEKQKGIMELPDNAPLGVSMRKYLGKNDCYLEIDNKAINHRPDLFSHVGIMREICAINGERFEYEYANKDFSHLSNLGIKNEIPEVVKRYMGVKASGVEKQESPDYIKQVISSHGIESKRLLVDVTNYSLYFYGQPTHIFDADTIQGDITIRFAKDNEEFIGLDDKQYSLTSEDIVIADDEKVLALGGVIGGKESSVSDSTTSIVIESAHFDQATVRKTGKRHGIRTDSLNVFEKDLQPDMAHHGASLIVSELEKAYPNFKLEAISDCYPTKQERVEIEYNLAFMNRLIGKEYNEESAKEILQNLGIIFNPEPNLEGHTPLNIPFWRKDLRFKADIAEEIARIDGYNSIKTTPPSINMGAVIQSNTYKIKNDTRNFFVAKGFFDMYNYSFVNEDLMKRLEENCENLVPLKNALSEEMTHMKGSLIPNLMRSLEENIRETKKLQLFEVEKVFTLTSPQSISPKGRSEEQIEEHYEVSSVITSESDIPYYEMQTLVSDYLKTLGVDNFFFETAHSSALSGSSLSKESQQGIPSYAHTGRTAKIVARGQTIGYVGEIHPEIAKRFDVHSRVAFFSINAEMIEKMVYSITKAKDISQFQMNNFDLSFVVDKHTKGRFIQQAIENTDKKLIKKVELFDIFESEKKLPGKRSLSFKVYIQSDEGTLDDKVKNNLIEEIVKKVEKKGGNLR